MNARFAVLLSLFALCGPAYAVGASALLGTWEAARTPEDERMYVRLARREEREVLAEFGAVYARYAADTPAFFPRWRRMKHREA